MSEKSETIDLRKPAPKEHVLIHNGKEFFKGTENECYRELQRVQPASAFWAMQYDGWSIKPT